MDACYPYSMKTDSIFCFGLLIAVFVLSSCQPSGRIQEKPHYWQRISASDQAYIQGPKAQQMLDLHIARCVVELRELDRLGIVKNPIVMDGKGRVMSAHEFDLSTYNTPRRNGELLNETLPYTDFEGCMADKGWERINTVPYYTARRSNENYLRTHGMLTDAKKEQKAKQEREKYRHLND